MVTLTPRFKTQTVCYAHLQGHPCGDCKRVKSTCTKQQDALLAPLTDDDKLILKAVIGEAEEFDTGPQANAMLRDVLKQKAHLTLRVYGNELCPGVEYDYD